MRERQGGSMRCVGGAALGMGVVPGGRIASSILPFMVVGITIQADSPVMARDLDVVSFDIPVRSLDILTFPDPSHRLHCDGLESDPDYWTLSPDEQWYCYDSGVSGSNDLVQIGWDDDGDRITGSVVSGDQGAAILRPMRAIGDTEAYGAAWTWLDSDWDWGGGVAYTVTADHVLLADAWVRSEGLLGDVSVQVEDCGSGGPPYTVGGVACQNAAFSSTRNSVFDGAFDGIAGPAWYPVSTWTIAGQDYESILCGSSPATGGTTSPSGRPGGSTTCGCGSTRPRARTASSSGRGTDIGSTPDARWPLTPSGGTPSPPRSWTTRGPPR